MPLAPGTHLGPYEIIAPLGAGGMGEVYRARDVRHDRLVAVKVLRSDACPVNGAERFLREIRIAAQLDRKSTRLNSSHQIISYAVFCLKKKKKTKIQDIDV